MQGETVKYNERMIARALNAQLFERRAVIVVPNTYWAGSEADLLVVNQVNLKLTEVEIKVSRADLLADTRKDKWYIRASWRDEKRKAFWPKRIWKHYYAYPKGLMTAEIENRLNPASGLVELEVRADLAFMAVKLVRKAKPNPEAKPISASECIDIARLSGLRMWEAIARSEQMLVSAAIEEPRARRAVQLVRAQA